MTDTTNANISPNLQELSKKANAIYDSLDSEFIETNKGKYIAIDIDSGEHFVADSREDAVKKLT